MKEDKFDFDESLFPQCEEKPLSKLDVFIVLIVAILIAYVYHF